MPPNTHTIEVNKKMVYYVMRAYGHEGPNYKTSYVKRTNTAFKTKAAAEKWAKANAVRGTRAVYASKSSLRDTGKRSGPHKLYYRA